MEKSTPLKAFWMHKYMQTVRAFCAVKPCYGIQTYNEIGLPLVRI